ncbi:MAG: protein kinase [Myxococcaceae bacterium]|nr:protein kinase [Myxococcaceae bacterium]
MSEQGPDGEELSATLLSDSGGKAKAPGGPPPNDPLPGSILGDYVVEQAVAWGGMGIVYRAAHRVLGRKVAVKVLRPTHANDPELTHRFLKEAQALSSLRHRGIVDIINFGDLPDGRQYMVMELLEGESLEATLKKVGRLPLLEALTLADQILDALSAAHSAGVVHRDLKPGNVFLVEENQGARYAKLVDFGLARMAPLDALNNPNGRASMALVGTPLYLAPEQATGQATTPRTDLYSFGVVLFELVSGKPPFSAFSVVELLNAHISKPAPRLSSRVEGVPPELDALVASLLEKLPEHRPASAEEARAPLRQLLHRLQYEGASVLGGPLAPLRATPPSSPGAYRSPARTRSYKVPIAVGAFVLAALGGWALSSRRSQPANDEVPAVVPAGPGPEQVVPAVVVPTPPVLPATPDAGAEAEVDAGAAVSPVTKVPRARTGPLTQQDIRAAEAPIAGRIKRCLEKHRADLPGAKGTLVVKVVVSQEGAVTSAAAVTAGLDGTALGSCLITEVKTLRFRKQPVADLVINLPFGYEAVEGAPGQ